VDDAVERDGGTHHRSQRQLPKAFDTIET
jgi:hypothetical protein